ncbi:MAG: molybdopterin-guanine dinucleotide biosynthesis protein B [Candidatus Altiarchaeales archaeon WOR_SM1_86-2]|nr:MAG: molybdopterin-guanine dinucleotide biosynthesis protein B [Candidatus Altiarchaeales archaeon WOR_SM1_86-2]
MLLGFYGCHNSGKTTLIGKLIPELKSKGYSVATLKNIPGEFSIDTEGKDTYKHKQAGSGLVVASSVNETAFIFGRRMDFNEITGKIKSYGYDVILVEGFKRESIPKVKVGNIEIMENTVFEYDGSNFSGILDYIIKEVEVQRIYEKLPRLDCKKCGFVCREMAGLILNKEKDYSDCKIISEEEGDLLIEVNGKKIWTGGFVKNMVKNVISGLISSLKGGEDAKEINIRVKM